MRWKEANITLKIKNVQSGKIENEKKNVGKAERYSPNIPSQWIFEQQQTHTHTQINTSTHIYQTMVICHTQLRLCSDKMKMILNIAGIFHCFFFLLAPLKRIRYMIKCYLAFPLYKLYNIIHIIVGSWSATNALLIQDYFTTNAVIHEFSNETCIYIVTFVCLFFFFFCFLISRFFTHMHPNKCEYVYITDCQSIDRLI